MAKDFSSMENSNLSVNTDIHSVSDPARRVFLGTAGLAGAGLLANLIGCTSTAPLQVSAALPITPPTPSFKSIAPSLADTVRVPEGYTAQVLAPWGEPIGVAGNMPAFKMDASNSAADQAVQMGMHHDGMHFYALDNNKRGLLVTNHEYTDDEIGRAHV